jgi:hypothetical protein
LIVQKPHFFEEKLIYNFPFGNPLIKLKQKDRNPKKVFVLGVYSNAVYASLIFKNGLKEGPILPIASEPTIFWTGDKADKIISSINIPEELGLLAVPSDKLKNGKIGRALDNLYLNPLGLDRKDAWFCNLLPEFRINRVQKEVIDKYYNNSIIKQYNLQPSTIPLYNTQEFDSKRRKNEILQELEESQADTLILLGDLPIFHFLHHFYPQYDKLTRFGANYIDYGRKHNLRINNRTLNVIPLCHPPQADRLRIKDRKWPRLHDVWIRLQILKSKK